MHTENARPYVPVIHAGRSDRPDEIDTVHAAEIVAATLSSLGYRSEVRRVGLDLGVLRDIAARQPACVFNLVDGIEGDDALIALVPSVLEHLRVPFTGCGAEAFNLSLSKCLTKQILRREEIPTADWSEDGASCIPSRRYIVKSDTHHGSLGMDEKSIVNGAGAAREIAEREARFGGRFFCEEYIGGREFNVALIGGRENVRVLPVQEIDFTGFPEDRDHIVDYAAKWDEGDIRYHTTNRRFGVELNEPALAQKLVGISEMVWRAFSLNGYARVDFRVCDNMPFVLEVNANPAISPDAGFAACAAEAGISYAPLLEKIIALSQRPVLTQTMVAKHPKTDQQGPRMQVSQAPLAGMTWRRDVRAKDVGAIRELVRATAFFHDDETAIAAELVTERLTKGAESGYEFIICEQGGRIVGYACFGKIDGTEAAFDLYWIAVDPVMQGMGLGREILRRAEDIMREMGARSIYIDTSSSEMYRSTRAFYTAMGYEEKARLDDFYRDGDGKVIFMSTLSPAVLNA